jgi:2-polyprenyl-3-methyl-5-hydroxy-6-metoxy-1,4-benzoquinol methylase
MMKNRDLIERTKEGLHASLVEEIPPVSTDASVLDIGCGTGAWLERLADLHFSNLYGVDLDIQQVKSERANISQLNLDKDELPNFGINQFDLITAIELVEHLENPGRLFFHISKLLKPNGYVLLTTPNIHSLIARLRFLLTGRLRGFDEKGDPTHIYPVYLTGLERVLLRYELEIIKISTYPKKGSITSRKALILVSYLLSYFLNDDLSGDNLFLLIRHRDLV